MFNIRARVSLAADLFRENPDYQETLDELENARHELAALNHMLNFLNKPALIEAKQLCNQIIYLEMKVRKYDDFRNLGPGQQEAILGPVLERRQHQKATGYMNKVAEPTNMWETRYFSFNKYVAATPYH